MSVKYTVSLNDVVIGTRKSAGHTQPIYTHAVVRTDGPAPTVLSYCSRLDLAHKEASRRQGGVAIVPVEAKVTTKKAAPAASWKVEVQADSTGTWAGNGLRYATEAEARAYAIDLAGRWTSVREWRVVED
jgi:hypothetical protein